MVKVLFDSFRKDEYIVKIDESRLEFHRGEDNVHCPLEGGGHVLWCKQHSYEVVQDMMTGSGSLFAVAIVFYDLPVTGIRIQT